MAAPALSLSVRESPRTTIPANPSLGCGCASFPPRRDTAGNDNETELRAKLARSVNTNGRLNAAAAGDIMGTRRKSHNGVELTIINI